MLETESRYRHKDSKRLYYLSMEFLMGRSLGDNLSNLRVEELCREVLASFGVSLDEVLDSENDAGLGNGGLGRLAACFLESMATLGMPGFGYGIDYEFGLFKQEIFNGFQREKPDRWKVNGTPFQIEHLEEAVNIPLYGKVEGPREVEHSLEQTWSGQKIVVGIPTDMPIVGYLGQTVNWLRLFTARASEDFDIEIFNRGDYIRAVEQKIQSENISRVLYPSDSVMSGKELRLIQEYFLVACAMGDIMRRFRQQHKKIEMLPSKVAIQMNDTHPSLAVAELMRVLLDEEQMPWEQAWDITRQTLAYTNHTLLPEALEKWSVPLLEKVLPRHMLIIFNINHEFLREMKQYSFLDDEKLRRMSIIEEGYEKQVRMAHLCIVGSHSVNGVSELHSDLLVNSLVPEFAQVWPEKFNNKTNGVAPRRWLMKANEGLTDLISRTLDENKWITDLRRLRDLEPFAEDAEFVQAFKEVKRQNKLKLAGVIQDSDRRVGRSRFDVRRPDQAHSRIQAAIAERDGHHPRLPGHRGARRDASGSAHLHLRRQSRARILGRQADHQAHPQRRRRGEQRSQSATTLMKVAFLPDYRVSLAQLIIPAADLSEQISMAGMEASGTGNMKLSMNGALTIGTYDGANIEIAEEVGEENIFIFGLRAEEIHEMQQKGTYNPQQRYESDPADQGSDGRAAPPTASAPTSTGCSAGSSTNWCIAATATSTSPTSPATSRRKQLIDGEYLNEDVWWRKAILNVARIGKFSSDRSITAVRARHLAHRTV